MNKANIAQSAGVGSRWSALEDTGMEAMKFIGTSLSNLVDVELGLGELG